MTIKYQINWDNGTDACGTFPWMFDTHEAADAYGKDWADESNLRDFGTAEPEESGYSFEVIEIEVQPADDDDPDNHEGAEHHRMLRYARP